MSEKEKELESALVQACKDLNEVFDLYIKEAGGDPKKVDFANWSSPRNTITWAEKLTGHRLLKSDELTEYPELDLYETQKPNK